MALPSIAATPRPDTGKGHNRRLRAAGRVPAVVYGKGLDPVAISLDPKTMVGLLNGEFGKNSMMDLTIEGEDASRLAIIKDYQVHPWKRKLLHLDLWQVTADTEMTLDIPFKTAGTAPVEKGGSTIEILRDYIRVTCKPGDLPAAITYDLTTLPMDTLFLHISSVPLPDGVKALYTDDYSVLRVAAKKVVVETGADGEDGEDGDDGASEE